MIIHHEIKRLIFTPCLLERSRQCIRDRAGITRAFVQKQPTPLK